jgi:acetyl esterase/lipase
MYLRVSATAFTIALALSAFAQLPSPVPEVAGKPVLRDRYPIAQITFPNGVTGTPNVVYWRPLGYRQLTFDLYTPPVGLPRPAAGFPLVVYVHGGGWMLGDSRFFGAFVNFPGVLASLAAKGYVVAAVNYRLSGEAAFPAPIQDVKAAIRWLRSRASEYAIDPTHVMVWGGSAGGHLAALTAVSCGAQALEPAETMKLPVAPFPPAIVVSSAFSDCVQGSVIWFGVFDIGTLAEQSNEDKVTPDNSADAPTWRMLGCLPSTCNQRQIAAASPVTYVNSKAPPMLLIVGSEDRTVPYHQTLEMAEKLKAAGVPHKLIILPGVGHGLIGSTLEQTRDANLKALDATFRFIDQTMNNIH